MILTSYLFTFVLFFFRYTHPFTKRQKGKEVPKEDVARAEELELFADMFAEDLYKVIRNYFPQWVRELEDLYDTERGLGKMGNTPFSAMGVTQDYCSMPHLDVQDYSHSFIVWFLTRLQYRGLGLTTGGEFLLPEYGLFFRPRHGTILGFKSRIVYHGTRRNVGFTQVAVALFTKLKIMRGGLKRKSILELE